MRFRTHSIRAHERRIRPGPGRVVILALLLAAILATGRAPVASAQSGCSLPPVTLPLFQGTPAAAIATPAAPTTGLTGRPLTDDEQAEAEYAAHIIVGCINTGVPKSVYAIFTPRYLAALFTGPRPAYQPAFEQMIAEGGGNLSQNAPAFVLKGVKDGKMLGDGRITVTLDLAGRSTTYHDTLVLAKVNGHWLIDEVTAFDPPLATPPAA